MVKINTFGAEIEKPVANLKTGEVHGVSQQYFKHLAEDAKKRGDDWHYHYSDVKPNIILGVSSKKFGEQGLDNGFNLLETSFPYTNGKRGLSQLFDLMLEDLKITQASLVQEQATVINMAIHPLGKTDITTYKKFVAPKSLYPYLLFRGLNHPFGIDAKAQSSPTTGVSAYEAANAISVILGFAAVFISIFGNSPAAQGKITGDKEYRLRLFPQMMVHTLFKGDLKVSLFPHKRFFTLKDYFNWMCGKGTNIWFIVNKASKDYKTMGELVTINGNPSILNFLSRPEWEATIFSSKKKTKVKPDLRHLELNQFAIFCGTRIRWAFDHEKITVADFLQAMKQNKVEDLFAKSTKYMYIEGRDPGANFPDAELLNIDKKIALSTFIAPSAIQAGLIHNLKAATRLLNKYQWSLLGELKEASVKDGLQGKVGDIKVADLTKQVLTIAEAGLDPQERWMLSYPKWVLKTGMNGADRALKFLGNDFSQKNIRQLVLARKVVIP